MRCLTDITHHYICIIITMHSWLNSLPCAHIEINMQLILTSYTICCTPDQTLKPYQPLIRDLPSMELPLPLTREWRNRQHSHLPTFERSNSSFGQQLRSTELRYGQVATRLNEVQRISNMRKIGIFVSLFGWIKISEHKDPTKGYYIKTRNKIWPYSPGGFPRLQV